MLMNIVEVLMNSAPTLMKKYRSFAFNSENFSSAQRVSTSSYSLSSTYASSLKIRASFLALKF